MSDADDDSGPFRRDRRYRVRKDFECVAFHHGRQVFRAGQMLQWMGGVHSLPYDSVTQHSFQIRGSDGLLVWDTSHGEDGLGWTEFFEELPERPVRRPRRLRLEELGALPDSAVAVVRSPATPTARPSPDPPPPLPDWREAAEGGRTLEAIALLEERCIRGQREARLFFELSRLNERLADETPAEYGLARAARYAEAIENIRRAVADGNYPGDPRFAEREIERLTKKVRAVQPNASQ
jgi:hypothetical protein